MIGHIDKITNSFVSGWACSSFDADEDKIQLHINNRFIKEFSPSFTRQGLVNKRIHKNGLCAFRESIEDVPLDLSRPHEISIRILKNGSYKDVDNSPLTFQPEDWIKGLLAKSQDATGQKILIVGLPKSGTSALTISIQNSFPNSTVFFEPNRQNGLRDVEFHARACSMNQDVITKCLYFGTASSSLNHIQRFYDKCIWIYRDPRDWLISNFLYIWYHAHDMTKKQFKIALAAVKAKEKCPKDHDFIPMLEFERGLEWYTKKLTNCATEISRIRANNRWCMLRFEDFLDGEYSHLNGYLDVDISRTQSLPDNIKRVQRAVAYGYWKDWFTKKDQGMFNEKFADVMAIMQYNLNEKLNDSPKINSEFSSEYMKKINSGVLK